MKQIARPFTQEKVKMKPLDGVERDDLVAHQNQDHKKPSVSVKHALLYALGLVMTAGEGQASRPRLALSWTQIFFLNLSTCGSFGFSKVAIGCLTLCFKYEIE